MIRRVISDAVEEAELLEEKPIGYLTAIDPLFAPIRAKKRGVLRR